VSSVVVLVFYAVFSLHSDKKRNKKSSRDLPIFTKVKTPMYQYYSLSLSLSLSPPPLLSSHFSHKSQEAWILIIIFLNRPTDSFFIHFSITSSGLFFFFFLLYSFLSFLSWKFSFFKKKKKKIHLPSKYYSFCSIDFELSTFVMWIFFFIFFRFFILFYL
jgi:hypothetical protein